MGGARIHGARAGASVFAEFTVHSAQFTVRNCCDAAYKCETERCEPSTVNCELPSTRLTLDQN